jgi:hypothetical protein
MKPMKPCKPNDNLPVQKSPEEPLQTNDLPTLEELLEAGQEWERRKRAHGGRNSSGKSAESK